LSRLRLRFYYDVWRYIYPTREALNYTTSIYITNEQVNPVWGAKKLVKFPEQELTLQSKNIDTNRHSAEANTKSLLDQYKCRRENQELFKKTGYLSHYYSRNGEGTNEDTNYYYWIDST